LRLITLLPCLGNQLVGRPLFGGPWCPNGFAAFILAMEQVWCVVRPQMMFNLGQKPRRFITGGLNHLTVKLGQSRGHKVIPGSLIAGLSELFQENAVAHRIACHQAQPAGDGFVLGYGNGFAGHVLGSASGFGVAVVDQGLCHLAVHLLLRPIRGRAKPVETGQCAKEADQANTTSTDLDADEVQGQTEPMKERESGTALQELRPMGTAIEGVMPCVPRLPGASGHLKPLGGWTLGDTWRLQVEIWLEQVSPLQTVPKLLAAAMVAVWKIDDRAHSYLACQPLSSGEK
jgi:hypothetical protein